MKLLAEYFELIVFTASHQNYADIVIDILDPTKTLFSKRLFRNSCIHTDNGLFIKDLRILNTDLKSTVIIDNAVFSFAFQLDNGIPIIPFYDDKEDQFLPKIRDYILSLKDLDDVRTKNQKTFSLTELYILDVPSFLKYYYDDEKEEEKKLEIEDVEDDEKAAIPGEFEKDSPRTKVLRRKSYSFVQPQDPNPIKLGRKVQAAVDDQLGKFMESLPKYLANHQENVSGHKI